MIGVRYPMLHLLRPGHGGISAEPPLTIRQVCDRYQRLPLPPSRGHVALHDELDDDRQVRLPVESVLVRCSLV